MGRDPYEELAQRFADHYTTLRGIVRHVLVDRQLREHLAPPPGRILDVGGGAGHQSIPLARNGYAITILDSSGEMLRRAEHRLRAEDTDTRSRVELVEGRGEDAPSLFAELDFGVALCHGVLMYLEDIDPLLDALGDVTAPGGVVSLLAKNAEALALRPALQGRFQDAVEAFDADRDVGGLGVVTRADTIEDLTKRLSRVSIEVVAWYGVRVLTDHRVGEPPGPDAELVLQAEWEASKRDPYRSIARLLHVVGRKR
ncbi:MAG: methyltransferase [Actinomycetota bacterium]